MQRPYYIILFIFLLVSAVSINSYSWELYDRVIATVNEMPIIESEIESRFERKLEEKKIPKSRHAYEKSRILDEYIQEALVSQTAARESIIVSSEKVDNHIEKIMERTGISSLETFKKQIEQKENMTFKEYREELKKSLMAQDVISIAIGVSPPTSVEAREYYEKNKSKLGFEVNIQHLYLKLKNDTFEENKRVYKEIKALYNRISKGESFDALAKEHSDDPVTRDNGGRMGWVALSDIARQDMIYANNIYKDFVMGRNRLAIVKSNSGYNIVKYGGKRAVSFENAKNEILNILYQVKQAEQFQRWVYRRRLESDIKIYMEEYKKERSDL